MTAVTLGRGLSSGRLSLFLSPLALDAVLRDGLIQRDDSQGVEAKVLLHILCRLNRVVRDELHKDGDGNDQGADRRADGGPLAVGRGRPLLGVIGLIDDVDGVDLHDILDVLCRNLPDLIADLLCSFGICVRHRHHQDVGIARGLDADRSVQAVVGKALRRKIKIINRLLNDVTGLDQLLVVSGQLRADLQVTVGCGFPTAAIQNVNRSRGLVLRREHKACDTVAQYTCCQSNDKDQPQPMEQGVEDASEIDFDLVVVFHDILVFLHKQRLLNTLYTQQFESAVPLRHSSSLFYK